MNSINDYVNQREYYPQILINQGFNLGLTNFQQSSSWQQYLQINNDLKEQKEIQLKILNKKPPAPDKPIQPKPPTYPTSLVKSPLKYLKQTKNRTLIFVSIFIGLFSLFTSTLFSFFLGISAIFLTLILSFILTIISLIFVNYLDSLSSYKHQYLGYLQKESDYYSRLNEYQHSLRIYQKEINEYQQLSQNINKHIDKEKKIIKSKINQLIQTISNAYNQELNNFNQLAKDSKKHLFFLSAKEQEKTTVGLAEERFFHAFEKAFANWIKELNQNLTKKIIYHIYWNKHKFTALNEQNKPLDYYPDILLQFNDFSLDIEIDEPYVFNNKKPHHEKEGKDNYRNQLFLKHGFLIIRFSEYQICTNSSECINAIASLCKLILPPHLFLEWPNLETSLPFPEQSNLPTEDKAWNQTEALNMARKNYRQQYLALFKSDLYLKLS